MYKNKARRRAGGFVNPSHSAGTMLAHWEAAGLTPPRPGASETERRRHWMNPKRHFRATSPGRSRSTTITGHSQGVLGHEPSASTHWNTEGHKHSRAVNQAYNKSTDAYHGIEKREWSDASGAHEPRYESPRPDKGSHPSYWDPDDPGFIGGPWSSWRKDPPPPPGGTAT